MRSNVKHSAVNTSTTHEGALSIHVSKEMELRRAVMSCMLWEDSFYESGVSVADRICALVKQVPFEKAAEIAIEAREKAKLRHVPLLIVRELLRNHSGRKVGDLVERVIQRPDEMGELMALYWKENPNAPLSSQLKIGLARAFNKFNEYQLAKWNKDADVKLRDVMFLCHARPKDISAGAETKWTAKERKSFVKSGKTPNRAPTDTENLFYRVATNQLVTPDTWEVSLSGGADKKETFSRLLQENKLGAMALLRNLRGMQEAGVSEDLIRQGIVNMKAERVLPFRFISAATYAPQLEDALEAAMFKCVAEVEKLGGKTALLIDHSGSMRTRVSAKSEISRFDAAAAVAMILREVCDQVRVYTFAENCVAVPPRKGFALMEAVKKVVNPVATKLGKAVRHVYADFPECDRIIVITDEQSQDRPPHPQGRGYIINVESYQNGVGYGPWVTVSGWSEHVIDYIRAYEEADTPVISNKEAA